MKKIDKIIYNYLVSDLINKDNTVNIIDDSELKKFVNLVINKKKTESHHKIDSGNEYKRWYTGIGGEMALEKFLSINFVDLSIGDSTKYHKSDLSNIGLDVGIKTVEYGKYPVIFKKSYKPEIIILKHNNVFTILGLADKSTLNKYQDNNMILSPSLRARGTKTAFTGLHKLKKFSNLNELKSLL